MTAQDAIAWVAGIFDEQVNRLTPETPRTDIPAWDSLGMLKLIAGLDEDFHILLTESELLELRSVGDILEILRRNDHRDSAAAA